MFESSPDFRMTVPPGFAPPNHEFWRGLSLSVEWGWFVLKLRTRSEDPLRNTFLLSWDTDVADAVKPPTIELESLLCLVPLEHGWMPIEVAEVWEEADESEAGRAIYFVSEDGATYAGTFLERVDRPSGLLIAYATHGSKGQ